RRSALFNGVVRLDRADGIIQVVKPRNIEPIRVTFQRPDVPVVIVSPCFGVDSEVVRKCLIVFQDHVTGDIKITGRALPVVAAGEVAVTYVAFRLVPVTPKPVLVNAITNGGSELVCNAII